MSMGNRIGFYPGTFDPITLGHLDIIHRALTFLDKVIIGVAPNSGKNPLLPLQMRLDLASQAIAAAEIDAGRVEIVTFDGLLVDAVARHGAGTILRGLRSNADFDYEAQLAEANRKLLPTVETVFILSAPETRLTASRIVREIARLKGDIHPFVPNIVADAVAEFLKA
ncbi:Phosphopantetheine adenylyltransferase [Acetobacteraceae bacterium EV16P]|uniref:Phosphopantetheine adenylyltransferase n=2 Tax=Sorlinia euscelidii TaxID=3081148 RepID=A0ABU7TZD1_9PROT